jgi:hypothetical protein
VKISSHDHHDDDGEDSLRAHPPYYDITLSTSDQSKQSIMRDFQEAQGETSWQQVSSYGAIEEGNVDDVDSPAERAALVSEAAGTAAIPRRHRALVAGTVVMFLLAAVWNIPASPLAYLINSDSAPGTPRGHSFYESSWKQWAYGVRDYWADKREAWKLQKTDLQAKVSPRRMD